MMLLFLLLLLLLSVVATVLLTYCVHLACSRLSAGAGWRWAVACSLLALLLVVCVSAGVVNALRHHLLISHVHFFSDFVLQ